MLKDLVVKLAPDQSDDLTANYALSIAEQFAAHITGVAFALEPVIPAPVVGGVGSDIIDRAIAENQRAAEVAIEHFEAAAKKRSVPVMTRQITSILTDATGSFGRIARCFDLSVVAQTKPDSLAPNDLFIEAALFRSGRPVVVVPYIQKEPLKLSRVTCCWDGSPTAARAIADATPFLKKAGSVELLVVATEKMDDSEIIGTDMAEHLARLGLKVTLRQISAADIDVGDAILSYVADNDVDFLVMGGVRPFALARVRPRRSDARHSIDHDSSGADGSLVNVRISDGFDNCLESIGCFGAQLYA